MTDQLYIHICPKRNEQRQHDSITTDQTSTGHHTYDVDDKFAIKYIWKNESGIVCSTQSLKELSNIVKESIETCRCTNISIEHKQFEKFTSIH